MAVYNEILSGRFNRALQKVFGIKGPPAVPQLAGEITAALPLFWGAESRYLEGWNRFGLFVAVTAGGAGNRSGVRIRNPQNSGVVGVIEKITIVNTVTDNPQINLGATTDFTPVPQANIGWDTRGSPSPALIVSSSNNVGALLGVAVWLGQFGANFTHDVIGTDIQEIPLAPSTQAFGSALSFYSGTLNQSFNLTLWWRERVLEDSEKT
jgi:hypothetical protein